MRRLYMFERRKRRRKGKWKLHLGSVGGARWKRTRNVLTGPLGRWPKAEDPREHFLSLTKFTSPWIFAKIKTYLTSFFTNCTKNLYNKKNRRFFFDSRDWKFSDLVNFKVWIKKSKSFFFFSWGFYDLWRIVKNKREALDGECESLEHLDWANVSSVCNFYWGMDLWLIESRGRIFSSSERRESSKERETQRKKKREKSWSLELAKLAKSRTSR